MVSQPKALFIAINIVPLVLVLRTNNMIHGSTPPAAATRYFIRTGKYLVYWCRMILAYTRYTPSYGKLRSYGRLLRTYSGASMFGLETETINTTNTRIPATR